MEVKTLDLWNEFNSQLFFFILKRVRNTDIANEILQNSFFKIHKNIDNLREAGKRKAWVYQIVRNEIINYYNRESTYSTGLKAYDLCEVEEYQKICCFDRFIEELPDKYRKVVELVYIEGKGQQEAAEMLDLSLANLKARIRRAKSMLKKNFSECCKFDFNEEGKLIGEPNCAYCSE